MKHEYDDGRSTLAITRRDGEGVWIGDDVYVLYESAPRPRIIVEAPRDMPVVRDSLLPADQAERDRAAVEAAEQGAPAYSGTVSSLVLGIGRRGLRVHIGRPGIDLTLDVQRHTGAAARFAVTAPRELTILRDELAEDLVA
ncbi:carbon storage regulator [Thioalkalivibrio sp. ALgr3]|uniref:carbon storage regulator n=1 Tax=Thioalkalivibrio sp. ALgr3 TaxID=1239292 RepID=UPI00037E4034|nr:carbon storage regulator [Thioalkalivibrio sp. ALgr3]